MAATNTIRERVAAWLGDEFDEATRREVKMMLDTDEARLFDAFYRDLEFGTGGLRGIMGAGTNRMNIYTVGMATQGLSNYLLKQFGNIDIRVAVAYDCRNNSQLFATRAAEIFSANGFQVYLFESLRPTPELSFAIRHFRCMSGVVITASHNPPEYNGYKVYWDDGGQVVAPHDSQIIEEVRKIESVKEIRIGEKKGKITIIGNEVDKLFLAEVARISLNPSVIKSHDDYPVVYSPIHGSGSSIIPAALDIFGFRNIIRVPGQDEPDGNFPTVESPNPEERGAMKLAIARASECNAGIALASDPDADRLGVACRDPHNEFILLNGNQTGAILTWYILSQYKEKNMFTGNEYIIKTIVTTDLLDSIAESFGVGCYNVLTGFKYIASLIRELEGEKKFICGGEESYGFLPGDYVRDKDAVASCALVAEAALWAESRGKSLFQLLVDIYLEHGLYRERLKNLVRQGKDGAGEINKMMVGYRNNPPSIINNSKVVKINDYSTLVSRDLISGKSVKIDLPESDVLQFFLEDGSKISVRPSGTEPKIKYYFSVNARLESPAMYASTARMLDQRIDNIINEMKLE
jgi:phosphoglucomutase